VGGGHASLPQKLFSANQDPKRLYALFSRNLKKIDFGVQVLGPVLRFTR
jgi:hypothetical protein